MLKPNRTKRLSDLLPQALGPAAARQGFAGAEIVSRWAEIVGPEISKIATPLKLAAPPRAPAADPMAPPPVSILSVRAEGAFALEVQHRAPEILERVNAHLGWACVGAVKVRQGGPSPARRIAPARPTVPAPTPEEARRVEAATSRVEDEALAEALVRLGRAALAGARR